MQDFYGSYRVNHGKPKSGSPHHKSRFNKTFRKGQWCWWSHCRVGWWYLIDCWPWCLTNFNFANFNLICFDNLPHSFVSTDIKKIILKLRWGWPWGYNESNLGTYIYFRSVKLSTVPNAEVQKHRVQKNVTISFAIYTDPKLNMKPWKMFEHEYCAMPE